ncbi:DUF5615 family PIN-like protein [Nitratifractor sp.]
MIRFLVDAQLPKHLALYLRQEGYDVLHTLELPEGNSTKDSEINRISLEQQRVVVSKDEDFFESILISDKPYKLLMVRTGNITNAELLELLGKNLDRIVKALRESRVVEITQEHLVAYE